MTTATVFNNCIGTMATVCQANDLIAERMKKAGVFPMDQVELAQRTAEKSQRVLGRLILSYLRGL